LALKVGDTGIMMEAYRMAAETALYRGEFEAARNYWEQSLALFDPEKHYIHADIYGQNPGVALYSHGAMILWFLGYPDQAKKRIDQALNFARGLPHPFSRAFALCVCAMVLQCRNDVGMTKEITEEAIELSREQNLPLWLAWATGLRGWALFVQGHEENGIKQIFEGLAGSSATGTEIHRTYHLANLAKAYGTIGRVEEGLNALDEALSMAEKLEQRFYEAELHRLRGELLLLQGGEGRERAESNFSLSVEIAHRQGARSLELRAASSLCRLYRTQGAQGKGDLKQLEEILDWFGEGFNTADVKEARDLLGP
jgi:predicted ATPase